MTLRNTDNNSFLGFVDNKNYTLAVALNTTQFIKLGTKAHYDYGFNIFHAALVKKPRESDRGTEQGVLFTTGEHHEREDYKRFTSGIRTKGAE